MQTETNKNQAHYDPRYFYIKMVSFNIAEEYKDVDLLNLKFKMGDKQSQTQFSLSSLNFKEQSQKQKQSVIEEKQNPTKEKQINIFQIKNEVNNQKQNKNGWKEQKISLNQLQKYHSFQFQSHIFGYNAEQFLNVYLDTITQKGKQKTKTKFSGYSRILLPPLLQYPHIKHEIQIDIINSEYFTDTWIGKLSNIIGYLTIHIYYQLNFNSKIQIIPISGKLERNVAQIGEMKPFMKLQVQNKMWNSLQAEGGIHPLWSGHFHAKKQQKSKIIKTASHNLNINNIQSIAYRLFRLAQNINLKEVEEQKIYFDCCQFKLNSASSLLKLQVLSLPIIGNTPDNVGTAELKMETQGFFKLPRLENEHIYETRQVKIYHKGENQLIFAGTIKLQIRFIFEREKKQKEKGNQINISNIQLGVGKQ